MTTTPCPGCGAHLQQHGWTALDVPVGATLEREHREVNGKPCSHRRGTPTHADYLARGEEALHCYVDAAIAKRAKEDAKTSSLGQVLTEALRARWDGNMVRIPSGMSARLVAAGCGVEVERLLEVAVAEFLALPRDVVVAKLKG